MSASTAGTVRAMMETVTGEGGTAPLAAHPRLPGRAARPAPRSATTPSCGCYRGYTMSFIGLAPVDDPRLVVAVTLQAPRSALGGGVNAGPVFKRGHVVRARAAADPAHRHPCARAAADHAADG